MITMAMIDPVIEVEADPPDHLQVMTLLTEAPVLDRLRHIHTIVDEDEGQLVPEVTVAHRHHHTASLMVEAQKISLIEFLNGISK